MSADTLLSRLSGVRKSGSGTWRAKCPAHDDRGPSLSLRELDDGRLLLHCFAGCPIDQVVGALGLEFSDLYPPRSECEEGHHSPGVRKGFAAADILSCIAFEALVVAVAAASLVAGQPMPTVDRERLMLAVQRLQAAVSMQEGPRWKR